MAAAQSSATGRKCSATGINAALLVGNRGSYVANSDLIVHTHEDVERPYS